MDLNGLSSLSDSDSGSEKSKTQYRCSGVDSQPTNSEHKEDIPSTECLRHKGDGDYEDTCCMSEANLAKDYVENHSLMETEDTISLPVSNKSGCKHETNENCGNTGPHPSDFLDEEDKLENEKLCQTDDHIQPKGAHWLPETNLGKDLAEDQPTLQVNFELTETVMVSEEMKCENTRVNSENGCLILRDESPNRSHSGSSLLGVKRARITVDEHQPSVHVVYNSLTRASKQKLEGLLQQWSEWHAQHDGTSKDPSEVLETGEETFFPALHVGLEKTSAVSFWLDNHTKKEENKGFIPLDGNSVPLYDRGYALGLTSAEASSNVERGPEIIDDAARCFNCGSYNHSLRDCPRPRDNAAVNIARKQHKSKRNQNSASRNPTRYYQNSPAGRYDGLRPGALDAETRQLLGLGELDPPPWLNRMREMGYPPGYLEVDDEDQPSGIAIYGDEEIREQEDGEILEADYPKRKRKKTVEFPGINAPIPENADERLWAAGPSSLDISRSRPQQRLNYSTDHVSRGHYRERRSSMDFRDDGPPGDPGYCSSTYSFHPRYGGYDFNYSPHNSKENISAPGSPTFGRSLSDRSRSPLHDEWSLNPGTFSSFHYSSADSPHNLDSGRHNNWTPESQNDRDQGRRHHRTWR